MNMVKVKIQKREKMSSALIYRLKLLGPETVARVVLFSIILSKERIILNYLSWFDSII
jgi:hypothetical protein